MPSPSRILGKALTFQARRISSRATGSDAGRTTGEQVGQTPGLQRAAFPGLRGTQAESGAGVLGESGRGGQRARAGTLADRMIAPGSMQVTVRRPVGRDTRLPSRWGQDKARVNFVVPREANGPGSRCAGRTCGRPCAGGGKRSVTLPRLEARHQHHRYVLQVVVAHRVLMPGDGVPPGIAPLRRVRAGAEVDVIAAQQCDSGELRSRRTRPREWFCRPLAPRP